MYEWYTFNSITSGDLIILYDFEWISSGFGWEFSNASSSDKMTHIVSTRPLANE